MSTVKDVWEFVQEITPELLRLGQDLFHRHNGDADAARKDITDRREEIAAARRLRDAELERKHRDAALPTTVAPTDEPSDPSSR